MFKSRKISLVSVVVLLFSLAGASSRSAFATDVADDRGFSTQEDDPLWAKKQEEEIRDQVWWSQTSREASRLFDACLKLGMMSTLTYYFRNNIGGAFIAANAQDAFKNEVPYMLSKIAPAGWYQSDRHVLLTEMYKLEAEFEVRKASLTEFNSQVLSKLKDEMWSAFEAYNSQYGRTTLDTIMKKFKAVLSLPTKVIKINDEDKVFEVMDAHLKTFDISVRNEFDKILTRTMAGANLVHLAREGGTTKASYLFIGEAGTGKTTTAEAMAKALGLPFCRISLASGSISDLVGVQAVDKFIPGQIAKCFIAPESGVPGINPVIFIDEIHDVVNSKSEESDKAYSILKSLTDPDQIEFDDKGLGIKLDLSKVTLIFGANAAFVKDTANALNSRLITIEFPSLNFEQKQVIAGRAYKRMSAKYHYSEQSGDEAILADIVKLDQEPGARILNKVIEDFVIHQVSTRRGRLAGQVFNIPESQKRNGCKACSSAVP